MSVRAWGLSPSRPYWLEKSSAPTAKAPAARRSRCVWTAAVRLAEVCAALARSRASRVLLVPLMLVAGDHAQNDMAGPGPHSWRSVLAGQGYRVDWVRHGLGSEKAVQDLYAAHLRGVLREDGAHGL